MADRLHQQLPLKEAKYHVYLQDTSLSWLLSFCQTASLPLLHSPLFTPPPTQFISNENKLIKNAVERTEPDTYFLLFAFVL